MTPFAPARQGERLLPAHEWVLTERWKEDGNTKKRRVAWGLDFRVIAYLDQISDSTPAVGL